MNFFYNKTKSECGITTLSLVVTIIVLLIISVIVVLTVSGTDDLFSKSSEAVETYRINQLEESIHVAWEYAKIQAHTEKLNIEQMVGVLKSELNQSDNSATAVLKGEYIEVNYKGYKTVLNVNEFLKPEENIVYKNEGETTFAGDSLINTNVCLYSDENIHKNFEISFNIESIDEENIARNTILSAMDESGSPWYGHNVKLYLSDGNIRAKIESNSALNNTGDVNIPVGTKNVKIIRLQDILYYMFDERKCLKLNDFTGTDSIDTPLTFGAALDGNNQPFRYFKGTISDIKISFLDDNVTVDDYNMFKKPLKTLFEHKETVDFDGKTVYFNTGECLFSEENVDKDFELAFNVVSVAEDNVAQATLVNTKLEAGSYPGFAYRLNLSTKKFDFASKGGTGDGTSDAWDGIDEVRLYRIDRKMYVSINGQTEKLVYDYAGFNSYFNVPLTIGATLDKDGVPFRYFKGQLSNIVLKVEE